ncbi:response regulator [Paenibacillus sp. CF384]|uniref:response regulator n=1 Tax=Paenibacillus sp. CF384 TaxID=1884382 RepID=UPI000894EEE3|nr:response regulator [Paenibacillus sp. CF384]SDW66792.1 two component transcriptional regulator, AraC family [Paenibacillus sp. CF384]
MLNLLIADDESIFREYLRTVLDWELYGYRIIGEAKNGLEALEIAQKITPDIALVDITMPFMDGLELAQRLKEDYPGISIVLITGHNEFDYARRALKIGVEDYILKPFSKDELTLTLLKLQEQHRKQREEQSTHLKNLQMMKESVLNRLVSGELAEHEDVLLQRLGSYQLRLDAKAYAVACIEIDEIDRKWGEVSERLLWKYAVTNILAEAMEDSGGKPVIFNGPEGRIICLYGLAHGAGAAGATSPSPQPELPKLEPFEKLCMLIKRYLKLTITIGVGQIYSGISGIRCSYDEALTALQNKFVLGNDRVIAFGQHISKEGTGVQYPPELGDELQLLLRAQDDVRIEAKLSELFRLIREQKLSIDYTYVICMSLVSVCLGYVSEAGQPIEDCFGEHFFPYHEIRELASIDEAERWMKELFTKAVHYTRRYKKTRSSIIAQAAKTFIEEQYGDAELGVEKVAQHVFINASYLRAVFKKENGMTVTDYITHIRMNKAKELLGAGNRKLSDIAESIGFSDGSYFSKSFKKFFGWSPSEYENRIKGNETMRG